MAVAHILGNRRILHKASHASRGREVRGKEWHFFLLHTVIDWNNRTWVCSPGLSPLNTVRSFPVISQCISASLFLITYHSRVVWSGFPAGLWGKNGLSSHLLGGLTKLLLPGTVLSPTPPFANQPEPIRGPLLVHSRWPARFLQCPLHLECPQGLQANWLLAQFKTHIKTRCMLAGTNSEGSLRKK